MTSFYRPAFFFAFFALVFVACQDTSTDWEPLGLDEMEHYRAVAGVDLSGILPDSTLIDFAGVPELYESEDVVEHVVANLPAASVARLMEPWELALPDNTPSVAEVVATHRNILRMPGRRPILVIQFYHPDPNVAAEMANRVTLAGAQIVRAAQIVEREEYLASLAARIAENKVRLTELNSERAGAEESEARSIRQEIATLKTKTNILEEEIAKTQEAEYENLLQIIQQAEPSDEPAWP